MDENLESDQNEKMVEKGLKQIREHELNELIHYKVETYTSQGMNEDDAITYINCLKTQDLLCEKVLANRNQTNHGSKQ